MQLLCLLASLLHVCWSLLTITLQCDINMESYKISQHEILSHRLRYNLSHNYQICCYTVYRPIPSLCLTFPHLRYGNSLVFSICTSSHKSDVRIEKMVEGSYCDSQNSEQRKGVPGNLPYVSS